MRILLLSDEAEDLAMGGPKATRKLQQALCAAGEDCEVWFRPQLGARPRSQRLRWAAAPWLARRALQQAARHGRYFDIVDAAGTEAWHLPSNLGSGTVLIARSHGLEHRYYAELLADARAGLLHKPWTHRLWYPGVHLRPLQWTLGRAHRVIVANREDRDFIAAHGWQASERIEVIPHGIEPRHWAAAPPPAAARGAGILFCGWWTTSKGVAYLAAAYARLLAAGITAPLTLLGVARAGAGWEAEQHRIRNLFPPAAHPLLRLLPRTGDEEAVMREYRRHDLLVCPSTSEGFGLVVIEALSQRLPVVATSAVGAAELLRHGREALLVPPRDPAALAAALARLWQDPALRRRMAECGHERVAALHWDAVARQTLACYRRARDRSAYAALATA